jgi:TolB protein
MICKLLVIVIFMSLGGSMVYAEKFNLNIYAGRYDSIPIGIIDFKFTGTSLAPDALPSTIITNDFDLCGRFQVIRKPVFDSASFAAQNVSLYIDGELSQSGGEIAFTCFVNDIASRELLIKKKYQCHVAQLRTVTHEFSNEFYSLLFGDKGIFLSRILYAKSTGGNKNIAIMDFDGYNNRQITSGRVLNLFPAFADSATFVFTAFLRGKPDIYRESIHGGTPTLIAASRGIQVSPAVSPIDETVAYASSVNGSLDIFTCAPDGSGKKQLTFGGGGIETAPCWSPSGNQIAYTSDRSGNPQIYIMDADGGNQHRITHKSGYCDSPAWSPKGDKIAFTSMISDGKLDIWVVAPDGSNETQLTNAPGHHEYPTWSPDGMLIGYITRVSGRSDFCVMKPDGSHVRQVTNTGDVSQPDWEHF